jgi:hypothetical protein
MISRMPGMSQTSSARALAEPPSLRIASAAALISSWERAASVT